VVLLGGGNSDKGGKEGGSFSLSFCGYFQKTTIPVETINPEGTGMGMERRRRKDDKSLTSFIITMLVAKRPYISSLRKKEKRNDK